MNPAYMTLGMSTVGVVLIGWVVLLGLFLALLWLRGTRASEPEGWTNSEFTERREVTDRRHRNFGPPPGLGERRSGFERRRGGGLSVLGPRT